MASIATLPNELLLLIVNKLDRLRDCASLSRASRRLYATVNPLLNKAAVAKGDMWPLAWASHCGMTSTLAKILEAGADANHQFFDVLELHEWQKSVATARRAGAGAVLADVGAWEDGNDTRSSLAAEAKWSSERSNSNHPASVSTHQASTDSGQLWSHALSHDSDAESPMGNPDDVQDDDDDEDVDMDDQHTASSSDMPRQRHGMPIVSRRFHPVHLAARAGHNDAIEVLLAHGASLSVISEHLCDCQLESGLLNSAECPEPAPPVVLWSPLHTAICHSRSGTAELLLSRGASVAMGVVHGSSSACTALHHAAAMGLAGLVRWILECRYQTDVDVRDDKSLTPFYYAYANRQWTSTVPLLLALGANINVDTKMFIPYTTITPLGEAIRLGHFDAADHLMALGADVTRGFLAISKGRGLAPLNMCCMPPARSASHRGPVGGWPRPRPYEGHDGRARMRTMATLIGLGALVDEPDCMGDVPAMAAAQNRNLPALRALLAAGADLKCRNAAGRTVLMQAVSGPANPPQAKTPEDMVDEARIGPDMEPMAQAIRTLLAHGVRLDDTDSSGNTVLHQVIDEISDPVLQHATLRLLLSQPGARQLLLIRNSMGWTAFAQALFRDNAEACAILVRHGYSLSNVNRQELVAMLKFASRCRSVSAAQVLDMDVQGRLRGDPDLFRDLLAEANVEHDAAMQVAGLMLPRGLPPLDPDVTRELLFRAVASKSVSSYQLAQHLIVAGADVNVTSSDGKCLLLAVLDSPGFVSHSEYSREQLVRLVVDRGANIHFQMDRSRHARPLTQAIRTGNEAVLRLMLGGQPLRNDLRALGGCYLHDAVLIPGPDTSVLPSEQCIEALLESGASITELDKNGDTPLAVLLQSLCRHPCLTRRYHRYIKALYGPGVNPGHKNAQSKSVIDHLQDLLRLDHAQARTRFLDKMLQVVDAPTGGKDMRFLPQPHKRVRPGSL